MNPPIHLFRVRGQAGCHPVGLGLPSTHSHIHHRWLFTALTLSFALFTLGVTYFLQPITCFAACIFSGGVFLSFGSHSYPQALLNLQSEPDQLVTRRWELALKGLAYLAKAWWYTKVKMRMLLRSLSLITLNSDLQRKLLHLIQQIIQHRLIKVNYSIT